MLPFQSLAPLESSLPLLILARDTRHCRSRLQVFQYAGALAAEMGADSGLRNVITIRVQTSKSTEF